MNPKPQGLTPCWLLLMNIVPNSMQGIFGTNDPVNGFYLGKLLNPDVIMTHIAGRFFGLGHPSADYFSLFPPKP